MDFVAGTRACEKCGDRSDLKWSNVHSGTVWKKSAKCPNCGSERSYVFSSDEDLIEAVPPELELGPGPSTVLDAATLQAEIERLGPIESTGFDWDRMERLQTALNELAKLVKARRARGVYRASVDRQREQLAQLVKARVAARKAEPETVAPRGSLDRQAQKAHWDWFQRGKTGEGRLDVVGLTATKGLYDGFKAAGARFEHVDFRDSNFNLADWSEVELVHCNLNISAINSTVFVEARILGSTFEGCGGALVNFRRANIDGSSVRRWSRHANSRLRGCVARASSSATSATSTSPVRTCAARHSAAAGSRARAACQSIPWA
jgi:hypothetical protein